MHVQRLRLLGTILIAVASGAFLGCASAPRAGDAAAGETSVPLPGKAACFRVADFGGSWLVLNNSELIVPDPVFSRWYLIKLSEPVFDLKFKLRNHVIFEPYPPDTDLICSRSSSSMDYLRVPHWRLGRVPILAVRELTVPERRRLLLRHHDEPAPGSSAKG